MESIQSGTIDFDRVIATPDMMGVVGRLGKVLGPKGLMPEAVKAARGGRVEFRVEKAGIIHSGIGKASFATEDLKKNFQAFVDAGRKLQPFFSRRSWGTGRRTFCEKVNVPCYRRRRGRYFHPSPLAPDCA